MITSKPFEGIGLDGRPEDLGKGYSNETMPVVSDRYDKWSRWKGKSEPLRDELQEIRELASRIHEEGKLFRLWAIPDQELAWGALLDAGVDLINTDRLAELNDFLVKRNEGND
jgi:hypothetical protein